MHRTSRTISMSFLIFSFEINKAFNFVRVDTYPVTVRNVADTVADEDDKWTKGIDSHIPLFAYLLSQLVSDADRGSYTNEIADADQGQRRLKRRIIYLVFFTLNCYY